MLNLYRYLVKCQKPLLKDLMEVSAYIVEVMLNKGLIFNFPDPGYDHTLILDFIMEISNTSNIFDLFASEKQKVLLCENTKLEGDYPLDSSFSWKINKFKGNFYKETEPFMAEEGFWSISLAYVKDEEENLNIAIKMCSNPYEEKRKMYFKKEEYYFQLPDDFCLGRTGKQTEEVKAKGFSPHALVYISAGIKTSSELNFKRIDLYPLIGATKMPTNLRKISKHELDLSVEEHEIFFYVRVQPKLSALISYISTNFDILHEDPKIQLLSDEDMYVLLRHKGLTSGHEDQIFKSVGLWRNGKPLENQYHKIFSCINWNYVSLEGILKSLYKFKAIRFDSVIKNLIGLEFLRRCKMSQEYKQVEKNPPRFRYKYIGGIQNFNSNNNGSQGGAVLPFLIEDTK